jgi:D-glycero-alpha-D-manno-heptose-7-phosphate kinase
VTRRRVVHATAPLRICDLGGWTDTWFAGHGRVLNLAVEPAVEVRVAVDPAGALEDRVVLDVRDYGHRYSFTPGDPPGRHPLLEATIDEVGIPHGVALEIHISSAVPPGASTGTSAAVTVALAAALDATAGTPRRAPQELAELAHRVEVDRLGLQSGIQDQLSSAHGGVCAIDMPAYPHASVERVELSQGLWEELDDRLLLVFLGRTHVSSEVHGRVIARLEASGGAATELDQLRSMAGRGRDALAAGDLAAFGRVMADNTGAQAALHPGLVSADARAVIALAEEHRALGWKVNGAGGEGGSITLLCAVRDDRDRIAAALPDLDPLFRAIPTRLSHHGVQVRDATR